MKIEAGKYYRTRDGRKVEWTDTPVSESTEELIEVLEEAREHIAYSAPEWHYRTQEIVAKIDAAIAKVKGT